MGFTREEPLGFGLALPHYSFSYPRPRGGLGPEELEETVALAKKAEELGFEAVWVSDHFFLDISRYGGPPGRYPSLDPLVTLAALAAETARVRLGTLVLAAPFRAPGVLAKEVSNLALLSGDRLELGLGAGWYQEEFREAGIEMEPPPRRIARLGEYIRLLRALLEPGGGRVSDGGRFYSLRGAEVSPRPGRRVRIWVGGKGDLVLRTAARWADGWNLAWRVGLEEYRRRLGQLEKELERAGRTGSSFSLSLGFYALVGEGGKDLERWYRKLVSWTPGGFLDGVDLRVWAEGALVGTAEEVAARVLEFASLGVRHFVLSFASLPFSLFDEEAIEVFAEKVFPLVTKG